MNPLAQVHAMLNSAPRHARPSRRSATRVPTVCVVDPQTDDYLDWRHSADAHGVQLRFVASAEEALRLVHTRAFNLWVINTELPGGLSGCELSSMLKASSAQSVVYLIANQYSPDVERLAWHSRANMFGCKGAHTAWLEPWLPGSPSSPREIHSPG